MAVVPPWMKIELKTPGKPRIYAMAASLKKDPDLILGKLVRWWCWLDLHTTDEHTSMLPDSVDALVGCKGFTKAMQEVGWAVLAADGTVDVVHWGEHNGKGAKTRVQNAVDVANCKANKKGKSKEKVRNETLPEPYLEKEKENKKMVVGKARLDGGAASDDSAEATPAPPPTLIKVPDGFMDWLRAISPAHPSLRQSRALAPDVMEGAMAAYERCPQAAQYGELLVAYFADRLQEDRHRKAFYRPTGQRKFFEHLEDVISHAERWDKEVGWSRNKRKKAAVKPQAAPPAVEAAPEWGEEERQAYMDDMKRELGLEVEL